MSQAVSSKSLCNRHQHMNQTSRFLSFFGLCVVSLFFLLTSQLAYPEPVEIPPGWYEVKAQTLLPNLHDSLRYTDTQKTNALTNRTHPVYSRSLITLALSDVNLLPNTQVRIRKLSRLFAKILRLQPVKLCFLLATISSTLFSM